MIPIKKAFSIIDRNVEPLGVAAVGLGEAVGRILAEDIVADSDLPRFDRSQMDGYAVVSKDTVPAPIELEVVGESAAGRGWHRSMRSGQAVRIMTGAPVPKGADAVQRVELTSETGGRVTILESVKTGSSIVIKGAEIRKGTRVFRAGEAITENMIAALASFGYRTVKTGKRPRAAILATGSEIVDVGRKPGRDQIRNSNSSMLEALARRIGARTQAVPTVADDLVELRAAIRKAAKSSEILIITGGVSVGKYDHTKDVLAELGADIFIEKIRLKPGKPMVFARLGRTLVFGLPGNPVSASVTFHLFARRAIMLLQGASSAGLRSGKAVLGGQVKAPAERDARVAARLTTDDSGRLVATPLKTLGSSDLVSFSYAECLIDVPRGTRLDAGSVAEISLLQ